MKKKSILIKLLQLAFFTMLSITAAVIVSGCNSDNSDDEEDTDSSEKWQKEIILTTDAVVPDEVNLIFQTTSIDDDENSNIQFSARLKLSCNGDKKEHKETSFTLDFNKYSDQEKKGYQIKIPLKSIFENCNFLTGDIIKISLTDVNMMTPDVTDLQCVVVDSSEEAGYYKYLSDVKEFFIWYADESNEIDMSKYEESFFDDFNGNSLDSSKWEPCPEWERQGHMQNHGWWNNNCVSVSNGNLVLEAKKASDGKFISGAVRTRKQDFSSEMFKQEKGIWEIKFKVEKATGLWYAFWMMADNTSANIGGGAVNGAEIDMFELLPGPSSWMQNGKPVNKEGHFMSTIHWDEYGNQHKSNGTEGFSVNEFDTNFYNEYHVFKFVWTDEGYTCYLDGKKLWDMSGKQYGGTCKKPGYMKISTEFGNWGGAVDKEISKGGSKKFYVDYVKVYKEK